MCGIAGFISFKLRSESLLPTVKAMTDSIRYRGPDDEGHWVDPEVGVALGQRRLSILDLSPHGHQPMFSSSRRYSIVFNGEVYNFQEIRKELEEKGSTFQSTGDTQVMLEAFEQYGIEKAVAKFNGMFAFALWDAQDRSITLARDRFGVKPLYYWASEWGVAFASELKPLKQIPNFHPSINRNALDLFLRYSYVPHPHSIYLNVWKLPQGSLLKIPMGKGPSLIDDFSPYPDINDRISPKRYWSAWDKILKGVQSRKRIEDKQAIDELDELLRDSIRLRMISDVPLGAFLSGGIDSSLVVALMQAQSSIPVKTFSIGFNEKGYNEAEYAKAIATHLGTDHTELYVAPEDALAVVPKISFMYDEPFADSSQIPTYLVSKLAHQQVTVSLSGDGGDEFFGGYSRFIWGQKLWDILKWCPLMLRGFVGEFIKKIPVSVWNSLFDGIRTVSPPWLKHNGMGEKLYRAATYLNCKNRNELYRDLLTFWDASDYLVPGAYVKSTAHALEDKSLSFFELMMAVDTLTYLTDEILVKVDRATMAVSLEGREPLLDYRLFEYAWTLPHNLKYRDGKGKWILREVLSRYVPRTLFERPKMGFSIPLAEWLRGPLRDWAEDLLNPQKLLIEGNLNPVPIRREWDKHLSGTRDRASALWSVIVFQSWLKEQK